MTAPACSLCGAAAEGGAPRGATQTYHDTVACAGCADLEPDRPGSALRAAARLLGVGEVDRHLALALREEVGALDGLLYAAPGDPLASRARRPQRESWAHVGAATRAALARALDRAARLRAEADRPEAREAPPSGPPGCLLCGVGAAASWRRVLTGALTPGPGLVEGHLCPACSAAYDRVGAVGPSLVERAARAHAGLPLSEEARTPGLRAWVATGLPPGEPWSWAEVRDPEPDLGPVDALRAGVADLAARVAALEAALR